MNKLLIQIIAIATMSTIFSTWAYAREGRAVCEHNIQDYDDIHCTYLKGLSNELDGKFIRHTDVNSNFSYTVCVSGNEFEYDVYQEMGPYMNGTQTIEYAICTDLSGTHCESLAADVFNIAEDGEKDSLTHYASQPSIYGIDISAVKDKYPSCKGLKVKSQALIPYAAQR